MIDFFVYGCLICLCISFLLFLFVCVFHFIDDRIEVILIVITSFFAIISAIFLFIVITLAKINGEW